MQACGLPILASSNRLTKSLPGSVFFKKKASLVQALHTDSRVTPNVPPQQRQRGRGAVVVVVLAIVLVSVRAEG